MPSRSSPGPRAGQHSTLHLKKLNDGQNDDIVMLRRRRVAEDQAAAAEHGRPIWDFSTWHYTPPALKGVKPVTPEPWARDCEMYAEGMEKGHGARKDKIDRRFIQTLSPTMNPQRLPKHVSLIERAMRAYRQELGSVALSPSSPRHSRPSTPTGERISPPSASAGRSKNGKTQLMTQAAALGNLVLCHCSE